MITKEINDMLQKNLPFISHKVKQGDRVSFPIGNTGIEVIVEITKANAMVLSFNDTNVYDIKVRSLGSGTWSIVPQIIK